MNKPSPHFSPRPVVVYQPHPGVGDLMWHLPFIRAISERARGEPIVLLTRATTSARGLLATEATVAEVHYVPYCAGLLRHPRELFATLRILRRIRPRAVWVLDKITRPVIAARMLGIAEIHGLGLGAQARWLTGPSLAPAMRGRHQIEKLTALLALDGIAVSSTEPELGVAGHLCSELQDRYAAYPRPWVLFGVGARNEVRRWPAASFVDLAGRIAPAGSFFVLGGKGEHGRVEREFIAPAAAARMVNVSNLEMDLVAALASECELFVGNDSGPLNVAAAVGTDALGLFGVTEALSYSRFIHPLSSPAADRRMAAITVDQVASLANRLLE